MIDIRHLIRADQALTQGKKFPFKKGQKAELESGLTFGLLMLRCLEKRKARMERIQR